MGGGRGWRNQFYATGLTGLQRATGSAGMPTPVGSNSGRMLAALKSQAENFENALGGIRKRIEELEVQKA
jgi:hypothetical protein